MLALIGNGTYIAPAGEGVELEQSEERLREVVKVRLRQGKYLVNLPQMLPPGCSI